MDKKNLELAVTSAFPIVLIETHEEHRVLDLLRRVCLTCHKDLMIWTSAKGLHNEAVGSIAHLSYDGMPSDKANSVVSNDTLNPEDMLAAASSSIKNSVIALLDFHAYLANPKIIRQLKELAHSAQKHNNSIVLIGHNVDVPQEVIKLCTKFELSMPDEETIRKLIYNKIEIWKLKNKGSDFLADEKAVDLLAKNLLGLSVSDAEKLIHNAIYNDDAISHNDLPAVMAAKYELLDTKGMLSFEYETAHFSDIGGFSRLKNWLQVRKEFFLCTQQNDSMDMPKGVLLLGVQGCGKSLAAKATAGVWGIPLLRLDFGALYNKYIGETEKNIRSALQNAEVLSPCILWVDEIEKGIQSDGDDSGTSQRILGTLLTWMAERKCRVFVVATSNNIEQLPPELIRKGRLDEIFFVDLPDGKARAQIFLVHLKKRGLDPKSFDLIKLVGSTEGFSGAEIEQAVVAARFVALSSKQALVTAHIASEINRTKPLSILMSEKLGALRDWARERTISAD